MADTIINVPTDAVVNLTGGDGDDTFVMPSGTLGGGSVLDGGAGNNMFEAADDGNVDISQGALFNIQTLVADGATVRAAQFDAFASIQSLDDGAVALNAATGGVYDVTGKSTDAIHMAALSNDGTTLIDNDADGEILTASASGNDTLTAGNGANDVVNAGGGVNTITMGTGLGDSVIAANGLAAGSSITAQSPANVTLIANGDISGATITARLHLLSSVIDPAVSDPDASVTLNLTEFNSFASFATNTSMVAATGGKYNLSNRSSNGVTLRATADTGTTLISGDALQQTFFASANGNDILLLGNGTGDVLNASNTTGNDILMAGSGSGSVLDARNSTGNDTLVAGGSLDVFKGGNGNDTIVIGNSAGSVAEAGNGYTTYEFGNAPGQTMIDNAGFTTDGGMAAKGEIDFGGPFTAQNFWFQQSGNDLIINILGTTGQITVANWFGDNERAQVQTINTMDGSTLDHLQVAQLVAAMGDYMANNPDFNVVTSGTVVPQDPALQAAFAAAWQVSAAAPPTAAGQTQVANATGDQVLITGNGNGDVLDARNSTGNVTLIATNGKGDTVFAGTGVETIMTGQGNNDTVIAANGLAAGSSINADNTNNVSNGSNLAAATVLQASGDISGATIHGIGTLVAATGVTVSAAELANVASIAQNSILFAATGGNYSLVGKSNTGVELKAASDAGTTLVGGTNALRQVLVASAHGNDILLNGDGAGDIDDASGSTGSVILQVGKGQNDILNGGSGDDEFIGGGGSDMMNGGTGNDTFLVGTGTGVIHGGGGNNNFVFDGNIPSNPGGTVFTSQYVIDNFHTDGGQSIIEFEQAVSTDAVVSRVNDDLVVAIAGTTEQATVLNYFSSDNDKISGILFADGVVWDDATIEQMAGDSGQVFDVPTDTAVNIVGGPGNDAFVMSTSSTGDGVLGAGAVLDGAGGVNRFEAADGGSVDISQGTLVNIQNLQADSATLTSDQFGGFTSFQSVDGGPITLIGATNGTYNLTGKSSVGMTLSAEPGTSVTLITDNTDDQTLTVDTTGNSTLTAGAGADDVLDARGSNGTVRLQVGNGEGDTLYAGNSDSTLIGGTGDDRFVAGMGNALINAEGGNNLFVFDEGGIGNTYTINNFHSDAGQSFVQFTKTVSTGADLSRVNDDLVIAVAGTAERIVVQNYFVDPQDQIAGIRFADGVTWNDATIQQLVAASVPGQTFNVPVDTLVNITGGAGDDTFVMPTNFTGDGVLGAGSVLDGAGGNNLLKAANGGKIDLSRGTLGNIQAIQANFAILNAEEVNQLAAIQALSPGLISLTLEGAGTYDFMNKNIISTGGFTIAGLGGGVDIIDGDAAGISYQTSAAGGDTVAFGKGNSDFVSGVFSAGDNTVTLGGGQRDDVQLQSSSGDNNVTIGNGTGAAITAGRSRGNNILAVGDGAGDQIDVSGSSGDNIMTAGDGANDRVGGSSLTGDNTIVAGNGDNDELSAIFSSGTNLLQAGNGNGDTLTDLGSTGHATLIGGTGDDIFTIGSGTDLAQGNGGNDTYIYDDVGAGVLSTINNFHADSGQSVLQMANINSTDVQLSRSGNDLVIAVNGSAGQVVVQNYFASSQFEIAGIQFADGVTLDNAAIEQIINPVESFTLTNKTDTVLGGIGSDVITATAGTLNAKDAIDGGLGTNTLALEGAGTFNLTTPATLANISVITAVEGQAAFKSADGTINIANGRQTVTLRDGMDAVVNVLADTAINPLDPNVPEITINGANDSDTINLGSGDDTVTVGSAAETINGGGGDNTINVTTETIGAAINGGSGDNTLNVSGGGVVVMGDNVTGISTVKLQGGTAAKPVPDYNFTANNTANLAITGSGGADRITLGDVSQVLNTGGGNDRIILGAATAGALIHGSTGVDTVELQDGGTEVLNAGDAGLDIIQLDAATNLFLTGQSGVGVQGSAGDDTINAQGGTINANSNIDGGAGNNVLNLTGNGAFNLAAPATVANIQVINAQEGQSAFNSADGTINIPTLRQTVTLRDGLNAVVNVASAAINPLDPNASAITINGANNSDVINLGNGNDTVNLGSAGESVNGGSGNNSFSASAAAAGALIHGGTSGKNMLAITGGGTAVMNAGDSGLSSIQLNAATNLTLDNEANLTVKGSGGSDRFTVGTGAGTTLNGKGGFDDYRIGVNAGTTTISNAVANGAPPNGEIDFLAAISDENLWFKKTGNNLEIDVLGTPEKVVVNGWFGNNASAQVTEITAGGLKLDTQVAQLVNAMASFAAANPAFNPATATAMPANTALQNVIAASWHG